MTHLFDDEQHTFVVLIKPEGRHSLRPKFAQTPTGWASAPAPVARQACLDDIDQRGCGMRPASRMQAMDSAAAHTHPSG
ncbi:MbtH family protein [Dyella silvatica]|uniref:MbtH family protein n=1 Tax=Dyella silvatica TaxID=2992128 RepID=UPI003CCD0470